MLPKLRPGPLPRPVVFWDNCATMREDHPRTHRWYLNETEGRYARTGIVESVLDLHLGLKREDGSKQPVGHFRLPLETLARSGFIGRRVIEGHRVFDVQIYRDTNGSYSLGVRQSEATPLAPYSIS